MRKVCVVTNYNYASFLDQCLRSVISQSKALDCIIVVDDGSTDSSAEIIDAISSKYPAICKVNKENGGQLSCFNAVADLIKDDDIVFFIDADDLFPQDFVELVCEHYLQVKADFVFVEPVEYREGDKPLVTARLDGEKSFTFASTSALTRRTYSWIGAPTSCISIKGRLYRELFPYPFESDWITRADDLLVFGASILGARKHFVESIGISYRIHGNNNFCGKEITPAEWSWRRLVLERMFSWYSGKALLSPRGSVRSALHELALIPPSYRKRFSILPPWRILVSRLFD